MANIIKINAGGGISVTANNADKSVTINNTSALTENQKAALNNVVANAGNKFLTHNEVVNLISTNGGGAIPSGFPKLFIASTTFTIPKTGKYKISLVGGGGGGSTGWIDPFVDSGSFISGNNGADSKLIIGDRTLIAKGGHGGQPNGGGISTIPYDGTKGALSGGGKGQMGGTGAGAGGTASNDSGGGGGSPLNFNTHFIYAKQPYSASGAITSNGYGYGAGGGGIWGAGGNSGGGGSSGYLIVHEQIFTKDTQLTLIIGAGGREVYRGSQVYHSGAGADGAAVIEWLGAQ